MRNSWTADISLQRVNGVIGLEYLDKSLKVCILLKINIDSRVVESVDTVNTARNTSSLLMAQGYVWHLIIAVSKA